MTMLKDLIEKGYFPKELVPAFNTKSLAAILDSQILPNMDSYTAQYKTSLYSKHNIARAGRSRRVLAIPNPLQQIKLSKTIVDNWIELENFINQSQLSLSRPIYNINNKRAFTRYKELSDIAVERVLRSTNSRYLLRIDITRFYASIYTHSIPWALHSKAVAKNTRGSSLFGNIIDTDMRNIQDGQTIGITIGPDTSLIISEIIGAAIDKEITKISGIRDAFRYLDDYFLFFGTQAEAESALSEIHSILGDFELEMNSDKSKVIELPESLEPIWVSDLRLLQIDIETTKEDERKQIISYYSKAFEYDKLHPNENVLVYALNRNKNLVVKQENWPLLESIILNIILLEPAAIKVAIDIFEMYKWLEFDNNLDKVKGTVNEIVLHHSRLNHGREVCWALWFAMFMNVSINDHVADVVVTQDDPVVALVFLDLLHRGLANPNVNLDCWRNLINDNSLKTEYWLLTYEALIKGWLTTDTDYISQNIFFNTLRDSGVSFYDTSALFTLNDIENKKRDINEELYREEFQRIQQQMENEDYTTDISPAH